jgi:peptidase E
MTNNKQIIAIGGAMGASPPAARRLFQYILGQTKTLRKVPNLLVINAANGDAPDKALGIYRALSGVSCNVRELRFFERTPPYNSMHEMIFDQDVIFVNGGNTKSMLAVWREYGLPDLLREAWDAGIVLSGSSAGAICWFQDCLTDSYAGDFTALACLGFLPGSCCPHFDGEAGRRDAYFHLMREGQLASPGVAINERVAVHYIEDSISNVVTTGRVVGAYRVRLEAPTMCGSPCDMSLSRGTAVECDSIPTTVLLPVPE